MKKVNNFLAGLLGTLLIICWVSTGIFVTVASALASCKWMLSLMGVL